MDVKNTSIIITGAASGFGRAMSLHFSAQGARVYAIDCNQESLTKLKQEKKKNKGK